jgi:RNA polymerase sigma-70 factor (ECF subfamily)
MDGMRIQFWNLLEPEHLKVRAFCRKLAGNRDDGDDLYQDSLVCALTNCEKLRKESSFRPWLYRIVVNQFKNSRRRPWWKKLIPLTSEMAETLVGENPTVAQAARRRLAAAFRALTPDEQVLVTLFELNGWNIAEIARLTGRSEGSVKVKLSRSRKKMREALSRYLSKSASREVTKILGSEERYALSRSQAKTD